jgi:hypothetical protein
LENKGNEDELYDNNKRLFPFMKGITIFIKIKDTKFLNYQQINNKFKPNNLFQNNDEIKDFFLLNKFGYNEKKRI